MKITIVGAGAMGSRFGYMLKKANHQVELVDTWEPHVKIIQEKGLLVSQDDKNIQVFIPAYFPQEVKNIPELIILFTKSMALESTLQSVKNILGPETKVLCLLNGLGHLEVLEKYISRKNIFMGVTLWTAGLLGPGHVNLTGTGSLEIENIDPLETKEGKLIVEALNKADLNCTLSTNVTESIWKKACVNGALNGTCTLLECNIKEFGGLEGSGTLIREIIKEFREVGKVHRVNLNVENIAQEIEGIYSPEKAGDHYPSMYQDLIQNHRLTEIDYINGYVAKEGKTHNIPTPYNSFLTLLIHSKEQLLVK
ncbi:2-dehydropantoate 2-reductase [Cetobacterium sp. SF1]|uniref:2-dehydropantoate 2-reductase n=1 Tax=Cetobacterium sp. SF1 TaxID=3417654 RepID=UPI003CF38AB3